LKILKLSSEGGFLPEEGRPAYRQAPLEEKLNISIFRCYDAS